ncbi:MAG: DEAD/DEAH box helicase family protein [Clostridiales Family XIII bacterium]|nr:DEAD/DEAH box helicase family protein [Clostridiales Family XIII bacterium]
MKEIDCIKLHDWQTQCIKRWFENGCRGIASVATGAGKTILALAAANALTERGEDSGGEDSLRVKVVVPKIFLAQQWKREIVKYLGAAERDVGLYYGTVKSSPDRPYMVYVLNSARGSLAKHILQDIESSRQPFLICDEVHHFGSTENAHTFDYLKRVGAGRVFTLGLSATPDCEHLEDVLIPAVGEIIFRYDVRDAVRGKVTSPYELFRVAVPFMAEENEEYLALSEEIARVSAMLIRSCKGMDINSGSAFTNQLNRLIRAGGRQGKLADRLKTLFFRRKRILLLASNRIECGVLLVRALLPFHRIIVFTERIATANLLFKRLLSEYPSSIGLYHSQMGIEQKQRALEAYQRGQTQTLICCRALDEGLDVPQTDVGILLSSSSSPRQRIQRVGRILRKSGAETEKRIYYLFVPNTAESESLLPAHGDVAVTPPAGIQLSYAPDAKTLRRPVYDQLADIVLRRLADRAASARQIENAQKQIARGRLTTDWMMSEKTCAACLKNAQRKDKEYLSVMLLMIRAAKESISKIHYHSNEMQ